MTFDAVNRAIGNGAMADRLNFDSHALPPTLTDHGKEHTIIIIDRHQKTPAQSHCCSDYVSTPSRRAS